MRVRILALGCAESAQPGDIIDVPDGRAYRLMEQGYAVRADDAPAPLVEPEAVTEAPPKPSRRGLPRLMR